MQEQEPINPQNLSRENVAAPVADNPSKSKFIFPKWGVILGVIVVIIIVGGAFAYILNKNKSSITQKAQVSPSVSPSPTLAPVSQAQLFSGHLQKLDQDLGIMNNNAGVAYYTAGIYTSGKYKGYTRYIAVYETGGPGGPTGYIFASKDGAAFILDGEPADPKSFKADDYQSPVILMDKTKIIAIDHLDSEQPDTITLDKNFSLSKNSMAVRSMDLAKTDKDGNSIYAPSLRTDFTSSQVLKSPISYLTFYSEPVLIDYTFIQPNQPSPTPQVYESFIDGTTKVFVVDSTGLAYSYVLANPKLAESYPSQMAAYNQGMKDYENKKISKYPDYPPFPNLRMDSKDIATNLPLFNSYDLAIPASCAYGGDTLVAKNVTDSDLDKIGSYPYGNVYVLKDKNHTLLKEEFDRKITTTANIAYDKTPYETFKLVNNGMLPPSYDNYVSKNPLLFIKDYWGRWVILGEYDYHLLGGCGKPVIYLYPPKPIKVSIKFLSPIAFDLSIPSYNNGWNVTANPDGTLVDLQPQFTNCSTINSTKFGSEYAGSACKNNSYPYLYWEGASTNRTYPSVTSGWIVERKNLAKFISDTFDDVGFSSKEKADFTSFWIPEMLSHKSLYFRISFLQNAEMNEIAPMKVSPVPDKYYRYFLDYLPLDTKPAGGIVPEKLTKIDRIGFTLVEWGGLLR